MSTRLLSIVPPHDSRAKCRRIPIAINRDGLDLLDPALHPGAGQKVLPASAIPVRIGRVDRNDVRTLIRNDGSSPERLPCPAPDLHLRHGGVVERPTRKTQRAAAGSI